jgi:hypothetical protein
MLYISFSEKLISYLIQGFQDDIFTFLDDYTTETKKKS